MLDCLGYQVVVDKGSLLRVDSPGEESSDSRSSLFQSQSLYPRVFGLVGRFTVVFIITVLFLHEPFVVQVARTIVMLLIIRLWMGFSLLISSAIVSQANGMENTNYFTITIQY